MNILDQFMAEGNRQLRGSGDDETDSLLMWDFTLASEGHAIKRKGTFSNAVVIPGTSNFGYDDNATGFLTVERVLFTAPARPVEKTELTRFTTGKIYFIEAVDDSSEVVYTLTLSIRQLATATP